jgi:hypothetical protein
MARRLVLHIGAMKSGTSFIQNVLAENKQLLVDQQNLLFPGRRWREQVSAVHDLIERGGAKQEPMADNGPWHRIAGEVNAWEGDAIISMEFLGPRNAPKIEQIKASFPDTDLHVVLTARDLARSIPAMWQESVQNAATTTWPDFLAAVKAERRTDPGPGRWFWNHQRLARMARRWVDGVGRENFTLITVPPKGAPPSLLWDRFASVAGIAPGSCSLDVLANPSIGAASAMVMRDLNEALASDPLPKRAYHTYVKHALAKSSLAERQRAEPVLGLDERWVRKRGALEVDRLRSLGLHVVGDLDELQPQPVRGVHTDDISTEEQLAAAIAALATSVRRWSSPQGRAGRAAKAGKGRS